MHVPAVQKSMAEFPALPLFTDAFIGDTTHLTAAQTGAYLMLLFIAWKMPDCALPNDDKKLARWARMDNRTWIVNKSIIMEFWKLGEDAKWRQARLVDERIYVEHKRTLNSQAGKSSALKRLNRGSTTVPTTVPTERQQPIPIPIPKKEEEETKSVSSSKKVTENLNRGTRLSDNWELEQEWGDWAEIQGLNEEEILYQANKFKNYWLSTTKNPTKRNWRLTWENWIFSYLERNDNGLQRKTNK